MPLHNNAAHLPLAIESLLAQSYPDFLLVMLDDGSSDQTPAIARRYAAADPRLQYHRRERRGMIATWREVAELAFDASPPAEYFAWVSDHDRWHPHWLARLVAELDAAPAAALAYPFTRRMTPEGEEIDKPPRRFDAPMADARERWRRFCRQGAGAGDMVYGLMRVSALRSAGVFRMVLRLDRLLIAELALRGAIRQVPEILWFRRNAATASVRRQRHTLVAGDAPPWFWWPPWLQHGRQLKREYDAAALAGIGISAAEWRRMRAAYQLSYGWRHLRRSETSYVLGRGLDSLILARKRVKHAVLHGVYHALVAVHGLRARVRRDM